MSNGLSQEEINALLEGNVSNEEISTSNDKSETIALTDIGKDVLGEVGNISMGSAATALSDMIGKKVNITTPVISVTTLKNMRESFKIPNIALEIKYVTGIAGKNVLLMKVSDAAIVANLMMGGTGQVSSETLSEIEESAVSEAMNLMIGSAATSMATLFARKVDISPPKSKIWDSMTSEMLDDIQEEEEVIQVAFKLNVENLIDSVIMQVLSMETAQKIISIMMGTETVDEPVIDNPPTDIVIESKQDAVEKMKEQAIIMNESESEENVVSSYSLDNNSLDYKVQKVGYKQFADSDNFSKNTNSLFDVPLNIQIVLGNAQRSIKEILNFNNGTLLELNQVADQPVELHVNGKIIAYGEVVEVNGNLGIHIIDINKDNI
ncbi:flagellar motor switch phosphatase FliY [Clostridium sp. DJ247]|uniref:flagellar motor switch phosphatase FliY n=1 Tax=Clostridium sp. DJ247 TaxID=2726188 RepID=UPI00162ACDF9|nr:flagellar motor switch phosphatase FliY [Clostridium sp. DJ247]MBC2579747.1 flagellar motor switch phosphatase FliY [Clostridium sp. DJ247]